MSAANPALGEYHSKAETHSAIAALAPGDMARLVAAARIRCRRFQIDRADLGFSDLVAEAITGTLSGKRRWRRDVPLIRHLIMTMKSIASGRRKRHRKAAAAGFRVERRGDMMPGTLKEEEDDDGRARPGMRTPSEESEEERIIAEAGIRVFRRHFAGDPAALAVIDGWRLGKNGKEIQELSGLSPNEFKAAARRVRRFAERLEDDADGG